MSKSEPLGQLYLIGSMKNKFKGSFMLDVVVGVGQENKIIGLYRFTLTVLKAVNVEYWN
jgi:hypothetical protein